jgi:hypothetical protein
MDPPPAKLLLPFDRSSGHANLAIMKSVFSLLLALGMTASAYAGGVAGSVTFRDSSQKKEVTITAPQYSQSCTTVNGRYQLELPAKSKGTTVTIKVVGGMQTTVKVPANGYAKLNFVFD